MNWIAPLSRVNLAKATWVTINLILTAIGLWQVICWLTVRTPWGKRKALNQAVTRLAHESKALFNGDYAYSVPAFLRVGDHHQQGVILAEWWRSSFQEPPSLLSAHDCMEVLRILNLSRTAIKQTLAGPKKSEYLTCYNQLYPRFNKLCEEIEAVGKLYEAACPISFSQERLSPL